MGPIFADIGDQTHTFLQTHKKNLHSRDKVLNLYTCTHIYQLLVFVASGYKWWNYTKSNAYQDFFFISCSQILPIRSWDFCLTIDYLIIFFLFRLAYLLLFFGPFFIFALHFCFFSLFHFHCVTVFPVNIRCPSLLIYRGTWPKWRFIDSIRENIKFNYSFES